MSKQVSLELAPKTGNGLLGSDIKSQPVPFHARQRSFWDETDSLCP